MADKKSIIHKYEPLWGLWRVEGLLGQSGNGEVYRVTREEWGKKYVSAVELISIAKGKEDVISNILNEIEAMYRLRGCMNIVAYEDHVIFKRKDSSGWDILIRMEDLESLPAYMQEHTLTRTDVIRLGIDICSALEACGKEGVIHGDIREDNIFVVQSKGFKLGNFRIAREISRKEGEAPPYSSSAFAAPEVLRHNGMDSGMDIYSLGMVMYKLLNRGRLPFLPLPPDTVTTKDIENSILGIVSGRTLPMPVDAGERLGEMVLKACSYNEKDRFKTPAQFRQRLERILREENRGSKASTAVSIKEERDSIPAEDTIFVQLFQEEETAITSQTVINEVLKPDKRFQAKKLVLAAAPVLTAVLISIVLLKPAESSSLPEATPVESGPQVIMPSPTEVDEYRLDTAVTTVPPTVTETPKATGGGEEYYNKGIAYLKKKQYQSALKAFEAAKKSGFNRSKADKQISLVKSLIEIENLYKSAIEYYNRKEYQKAAEVFEELVKRDESYKEAPQYAECLFQIAGSHNLLGVQYYNEGRFEDALREFEAALEQLSRLKSGGLAYDGSAFAMWQRVYQDNKEETISKAAKIDECLRLAEESNKTGVQLFNEKKYILAKQQFEEAVEYMHEIRRLSPKYSAMGYEGLLKIYSDNLSRVEKELK